MTLGIDLKKDVSEKKYTIKAEGDTVLYIVNFYYGEVLNVYYSENHKTSYSNRNLYTIGKTTSEDDVCFFICSFIIISFLSNF